ncbi:acetylglutamate kinase [Virgibacillus ndiopensis]|uniref:acetylglutamate kinase n=1 Tax=Virgibacillus ndiopensis TaxID=2004408 RepID=UPI000C0774E0|nr:acetylglutamate kinase [Virgibacillus ndiopensis]
MDGIIVLKCGGSTIDMLSNRFFTNLVTLKKAGLKPIIVHGGGPAIKDMLTIQKVESEFVDGLRKTTKSVMDVVETVLTGQVNNALSRRLNNAGIPSVGLSGSDAKLLKAKAKDFARYGYVGDIVDVNVSFLLQLIGLGIAPVIAPIAIGDAGVRYNINADTAAGAVAKAIGAEKLIFVTDVPGVMQDDKLLNSITDSDIERLITEGIIHGGMIPKVRAAIASLHENLQEVMIIDGNQSGLAQNTKLVGTVIKKSVGVV